MTCAPRDGVILIVDDMVANLELVAEYLEGSGYQVLIAQEGEEALERSAVARPDLILLDVMLPGIDGFEVCRRLKSHADTRDIPVIFMTALAETDDKLRGFAVGAIDYVTKPLQNDEVLARIDTHMRVRWLQRALEEKHAELLRSHAVLERRVAERTEQLSEANRLLRLEIEERKQAEEQHLLKKFALEHVREGAYLLDEHGRILYVNSASCRMTGYSCEELESMHVWDIDPDWSPDVYRDRWPRLRAARNVLTESRHRAKDGTLFVVEIGASYFEYEGKGYNLSLARDITVSKATEATLRESERQFRTLAENSPDLIIRYDRDCRRLYVNPAYVAFAGGTAATAVGKAPGEGWHGSVDVQDYKRVLRRVIETGVRAESLMTWHPPGGEPAHYLFHSVPEYDADGTVVRVLTIGRDVTALKEAEWGLQESRRQLRELAARQDMAREEERKHIARELHDELGQSLTALRMSVSLLRVRFGQDDPALTDHAKAMTELVDRNIRFVRNVSSSLRPAALDMGIQSALEWLVDEFAAHAGIACTLHIMDSDIALDDSSGTTIFRIVQESLTNVARHAAATRVRVTLDRYGDFCRVTVRDNGKGFDPRQPRKTSLGLIGMQERVLMAGGDIDIDSEPGRGTVLVVRVPAGSDAVQPASQ